MQWIFRNIHWSSIFCCSEMTDISARALQNTNTSLDILVSDQPLSKEIEQAFLFTAVSEKMQNKNSNKDSKWETSTLEKENISATTNKAATANLDCALAGKASTWTVWLREKPLKNNSKLLSRKRSLSNSPSVANMQKGIEHINQTSLPKTRSSLFVSSASFRPSKHGITKRHPKRKHRNKSKPSC